MAATQGLPAHFFDALKQSISSKEGVLCFIGQLDPSLAYKHPESILRDLQASSVQPRHCLELVLSSGLWADPLSGWLLRSFPAALPETANDCLHLSILQRLVKYAYFSVPETECQGDLDSLQDDVQFALHAPEAIAKLTAMQFDDEMNDEIDDGDWKGGKSRKRPSQAERKRQLQAALRKKKEVPSEVEVGLRALGITSVPGSPEAAQELALRVLLDSKDLLAKYLSVIRTEKVSEIIRSSLSVQQTVKRKPRAEPIITNLTPPEVVSPMTASAFETPLKAALYFDSASDLGDWEVVVSGRAIRDIRAAQKRDRASYNIIMKKINELSHSHFSDDNQKVLIGGPNAVPVYEAKMTSDSRLVYHIHCQPDHSGERERQVIRVFGVFTHAQLDRVWESLGYQLARLGGREYRSRCCQRVFNRDRSLVIPAVFPPNEPGDEEPISIPELPAEDLEEIHSILVLEKFVNFSKELRNSLVADLDVQHVFNLSSQEMAIIEHPFSCYVLGRSGTGKTTTMLFKMLGLERTFSSLQLADVGAARPRQLFVTQSPVLAARVEDYFTKLLASLELGQKSESDLMKIAAERARRGTLDQSRSMVHKKDLNWKTNLPDKFSSLQDGHFPLFLTFEQLAGLIIGDVLDSGSSWLRSRRDSLDKREAAKFNHLVALLSASKDVLTFPEFISGYWARFPQDLTKGLDPALVFSEIIGVIKGAEQSITCEGRCLDKDAYLSLGERTNYLFASKRETIYRLFTKYSRRKRELRGYDAADRTHALLEVFNLVGVPGTRVDFLYVDEAQDNMLIDAMLLRSICKNPLGLFWAGDTAQTIAIGNSFRFQDLKSFIYRLEERRVQQSLDVAPNGFTHKPADFTLATNYRSHGGIIACAHSVIEMITRFWPASLDKMAPEKGIVNGIKPLFLVNSNPSSLQFRDLMTEGESDIEFGAAQCILVRDSAARDRLLKEVGEVGIIMTLYDSKGLEFDDVLLYQFFEDSTVDMSRWRVLLNMMPDHERPPAPHFDPIRHASLCSELKFLYVAVTRARKKLWIYDSSDKAGALQHVWTSLGLIDNFDPSGGQQLPRFASASSRQEWQEAADRLFDNENYAEAVLAFKRAGSTRQAYVAQAYQLRKEAELTLPSSARKNLFRAAATAFLQCAEEAVDRDGPKVFRRVAGLCFCQAEDYALAAAAYRAAQQYASALQMYRKVGMFDEGVEIVKDHSRDIKDKALVDDFKDVAKVFYFKEQELSKAQELFDSSGEALAYLEDNTYLDESRAKFLESQGKPIEAADVHLDEGRLMEATRVLLANPRDSESTARGYAVVIQGLWQTISFGNMKHIHKSDAKKLVELASHFPDAHRDKVSIFLAIDHCDWGQTRELGRKLILGNRHAEALLCLSYALHPSNLPNMERFNNEEIASTLADLVAFCSLLRYQADNLNLRDEGLQRLFNFHPSQIEDTYVVSPGSWLHRVFAIDPTAAHIGSEGRPLPSQALEKRLRDALLGFTAEVIQNENKQCRSALAFTPCLPFALTGYCKFGDKCFRQHLSRKALDQPWYTAQVRMHLQQIVLSQIIESIPSYLGGGLGGRRYWLSRLYQTLDPSSYVMGSGFAVDWSKIPESRRALGVAHNWCRHLLDGRPGQVRSLELSSVYQATELCFRLDREQAGEYVQRSMLVHRHLNRDASFLGALPNGRQVFVLLDLLGSLDASRPYFLEAGTRFAEHVVSKRLAIDINVLCNFVEFLSGAFVVVQQHCHWHNITLPRSWFLLLVQRMRQQLPLVNTRPLFRRLMRVLSRLLHTLLTGENADHLQYGKVGASVEPLYIRRLFIARICRAMCIIGYNIPHDWIHKFILEQLMPLKSLDRHSPLYAAFALADTWKDVVHAIWNSTRESPFDDLVHLWSAELREPWNRPPGNVTRIVFKKISDIAYLLRNETPPMNDDPLHDLPAPPGEQDPMNAHQSSAIAPTETVETQGGDSDHAFSSSPEEERFDTALDATDPNVAAPGVELEADVLAAAEVLCKAYQRLLKRRQCENRRAPREVACRNFYEACLAASGNIDWPVGSTYRKLYLGAVPHLLVVTQWIQAYVTQEKRAAKGALKLAKGSVFEEVLGRTALINDVEKALHRILKTLDPRSHFHLKRDTRQLRQVGSEVEILLRRLPRAQADEVEFDMHMARPPVKVDEKPRKPSLNWDEDDD
ncbi:hypothetical protein BKA70DRAFT_1178699 [Coprinopsis sp. MPI-PUGE-AT-0042]|nr:hypothetical protein BKA70DRAFT_1178699 [Coprinopsis sp. MPI-PUGE-AT-0042]